MRDVSKHFGAVEALSKFSLKIEPGSVVGLMGDNGAGKSTAIKLIAGNFPPSSGELLFNGQNITLKEPSDARNLGIEVVYQDLALCENLTAAENVFLGREVTMKIGPLQILNKGEMLARCKALFADLKSDTPADRSVRKMSGGQRQAVALARTLLANAKLVILDEPTAAISVRQVAEVLRLIERLRQCGVAVILISHRMPDIFSVCERVVVLRRGIKVADTPIGQTSAEEVTGLITGSIESRLAS